MNRLGAAWDAVVIGGGPAGAVAALWLAQRLAQRLTQQWHPEPARRPRLLILEQSPETGPETGVQTRTRIGESLPPACRPLLRDLGLLDRMEGHRPYLGNRTLWGGGVATHDFLRDPQGAGWHLDRAAFDAMLQAEAVRHGAVIRRGVTVRALTRKDGTQDGRQDGYWDGYWGIVTSLGHRLRARVLIDATGRAAAISRRLGAERRILDRLTGVYAVLRGGTGHCRDGFSRIEAAADGWWYTAPLPTGDRVVAFHSDSDRPVLRGIATPAGFLAALRRTRMIAAEISVDAVAMLEGPFTVPAHSAMTDPPAGAGWLAVGDAALALDPLSSQGLMNALFTGMAGGDAAAALLDGNDAAARVYSARITQIRSAYEANLAYFYDVEATRRDGPFWTRRRPAPMAAAGTG